MPVSQMKNRIQALHLLDRALSAMTDDEITALIDALPEDHREALEKVASAPAEGFADGAARLLAVRAAATRGRMSGALEQVATVLTDPCLADCIEQLGDHADNPSEAQLLEVTPGLVERHGLGVVRLMMASSVAGEAAASAMLTHLLKHDETLQLPPLERASIPLMPAPKADDELRAKRKAAKQAKQAEAAARRAQQARARHRV
jgi:hypothetical protein